MNLETKNALLGIQAAVSIAVNVGCLTLAQNPETSPDSQGMISLAFVIASSYGAKISYEIAKEDRAEYESSPNGDPLDFSER